jgi:hypothetical protein
VDFNSSEPNPYAPPAIESECLATPAEVLGAWCDGSRLVMHRQHILPPICAKTLEPADGRYVLYVGFLGLQRISIPVTRRWIWRRWLWFFVYLSLSFVVIPVLTFALVAGLPFTTLKTVIGIAGVCGAAFCFLMANELFTPFAWSGRKGAYVSISGFAKGYLEQLPPWPGVGML